MLLYIVGISLLLLFITILSFFPRLYQVYKIEQVLKKYYPVRPHWFWGHLKVHPGPTEAGLKKNIEWTESYPRCFAFNFGPVRPVLMLNHPDTVKQLLKTAEPKPFVGGGGYKLLFPWLGDGLLLSKGDKWFRNRRLLTPGFHFDVLKPYMNINNECTKKLIRVFENESGSGKSVEIFKPVSLHTLDVVLRCAFTYQDEIQETASDNAGGGSYVEAVIELSRLIAERAFNPIMYLDSVYSKTTSGQSFKNNCDFSHAKAMDVIHKRRKALENGEDPTSQKRYVDFLDILLLARDEDGKGLTDNEIQDEVETFMFEGHDTTASGISWILYNLARHPEIQEKAFQEVHRVLGNKKEVQLEHLPKLEYLTMCIKESLRLHPPVHFTSRELTKPMTIDGTVIPPGTVIDSSIYLIHHNPVVWGKDHMTYNPDRFLPDNITKMDPFAFIPFSAGPRNCIGQTFAMNEMKTTVALVLHTFKLSVDPDHKVEMAPLIILKAKDGIKLYLEKRTKLNS